MKRLIKCLLVTSLVAGALAGAPVLRAADAAAKTDKQAPETAQDSAEKTKAKRDSYPFSGYVSSVDKQAMTISLKKKEGERVLKVDSKSKLELNGKPALFGSVQVGDYAHGTLHKDAAGKEVINSAKFDKEAPRKTGKKTGEESTPAKPETKQKS